MVVTKFIFLLLLTALPSNAAGNDKEESNDIPTPAQSGVKLDATLRKALLRALAELENDSQNVEQPEDNEENSVHRAQASSFTIYAKTTNGNTEAKDQITTENNIIEEETIPTTNNPTSLETEKIDLDTSTKNPNKPSFVIFQRSNSILEESFNSVEKEDAKIDPLKDTELILTSASNNFNRDVSLDKEINKIASNKDNFEVKNGRNLKLGSQNAIVDQDVKVQKNQDVSPTVSATTVPPYTTTLETEAKVEQVQFFSAPLVAAFTVHQDEQGQPKKVEPIYKNVENSQKQDIFQSQTQKPQFSSSQIPPQLLNQSQDDLRQKQQILEDQLLKVKQQQTQQELFFQQQLLQQQSRNSNNNQFLQQTISQNSNNINNNQVLVLDTQSNLQNSKNNQLLQQNQVSQPIPQRTSQNNISTNQVFQQNQFLEQANQQVLQNSNHNVNSNQFVQQSNNAPAEKQVFAKLVNKASNPANKLAPVFTEPDKTVLTQALNTNLNFGLNRFTSSDAKSNFNQGTVSIEPSVTFNPILEASKLPLNAQFLPIKEAINFKTPFVNANFQPIPLAQKTNVFQPNLVVRNNQIGVNQPFLNQNQDNAQFLNQQLPTFQNNPGFVQQPQPNPTFLPFVHPNQGLNFNNNNFNPSQFNIGLLPLQNTPSRFNRQETGTGNFLNNNNNGFSIQQSQQPFLPTHELSFIRPTENNRFFRSNQVGTFNQPQNAQSTRFPNQITPNTNTQNNRFFRANLEGTVTNLNQVQSNNNKNIFFNQQRFSGPPQVNRQLNHLLFNQGFGGRNSEDLNVVTKILSQNFDQNNRVLRKVPPF